MVADDEEGRQLLERLASVCDQFLDVSLRYAGAIPFDHRLREAVKAQRAVSEYAPSAPSSLAFHRLADELLSWPVAQGADGHLQFFVESLVAARVGEQTA